MRIRHNAKAIFRAPIGVLFYAQIDPQASIDILK